MLLLSKARFREFSKCDRGGRAPIALTCLVCFLLNSHRIVILSGRLTYLSRDTAFVARSPSPGGVYLTHLLGTFHHRRTGPPRYGSSRGPKTKNSLAPGTEDDYSA